MLIFNQISIFKNLNSSIIVAFPNMFHISQNFQRFHRSFFILSGVFLKIFYISSFIKISIMFKHIFGQSCFILLQFWNAVPKYCYSQFSCKALIFSFYIPEYFLDMKSAQCFSEYIILLLWTNFSPIFIFFKIMNIFL